LETPGDAIAHSLVRYLKPYRQIQGGTQPRQDSRQTFGLPQCSGKPIEDESVAAMQT
jgi:hypothetical protein